ncbi:unnamed protein product [Paramecium primaurelia]|uniref:Uncharacterized protein n=1 Tax=Paramecium primaurelia TaxID=5886 RepID=A0A8S1QC99_PARPR|nr:unnamed protein product [Paramecium primaurelia]
MIKQDVIQTIIQEGINLMKQLVGACFDASCYCVSQPEAGSIWISYLDGSYFLHNGQVVSLFYHPTRKHTATTIGKLGKKQSVADAGQWAYSIQTKGAYGNKTYYNIL